MVDILKEKIDEILLDYEYQEENLLPILLEIQDISEGRYITPETARYIADGIDIPYVQLSEVFSFFAALNQSKKGKYHIEMCNSTVCRVNHQELIKEYLKEALQIEMGETTLDNLFTLDYAPCFGACDTSPSVRINKKVYGNLTVEKIKRIIENLKDVEND
jgi:NADH-quinone oxidoreductase subunit E